MACCACGMRATARFWVLSRSSGLPSDGGGAAASPASFTLTEYVRLVLIPQMSVAPPGWWFVVPSAIGASGRRSIYNRRGWFFPKCGRENFARSACGGLRMGRRIGGCQAGTGRDGRRFGHCQWQEGQSAIRGVAASLAAGSPSIIMNTATLAAGSAAVVWGAGRLAAAPLPAREGTATLSPGGKLAVSGTATLAEGSAPAVAGIASRETASFSAPYAIRP